MSKSDAHRPEFTVRCACGIEYHTSDTHLGHALPCKCGQTVVIARPAESAKPEPARTRRKKRRFQATESETRRAVHLNSGFRQKGGLVSSFLYPLRFGNLAERGTFLLAVLYLGAMFASWMLLRYGSERTIPGTVIAYGPRFLSLLPLSMLVPAALLFARGALLPLAMAACIGLVPVMGARVSVATLRFSALPAKPAEGTFRVLTFNVQGGRQMGRDLAVMLREQAPDIVLFQECGEYLWKKMRQQTAWHSRRYGSLCTTSRWPVTDVQTMPRDEIVRMSNHQWGRWQPLTCISKRRGAGWRACSVPKGSFPMTRSSCPHRVPKRPSPVRVKMLRDLLPMSPCVTENRRWPATGQHKLHNRCR